MAHKNRAPRGVSVACNAYADTALKVPYIYAVSSAIVPGAAYTAAGVEEKTKEGNGVKPKEYLSQIRRLDVLIEQKIREKDELAKYDISAMQYDVDRVQVSSSGEAPQVRVVEKLIEYEKEIDIMIDSFYDLKRRIISQIQALPRVEHVQLLYKRYVEYKRLEAIALEMGYSFEWVRHIHGNALAEFGRKFIDD